MMENNRVKQALNKTLSSLYVSDHEAIMLLAHAKGGRKVKKKLSVAFVMMMILVTLTVTALAMITIREVGRQVAENEKKQGYFIDWTLEQKKKLISSLVELRYLDKSEDTDALTTDSLDDQSAHQIANKLITEFAGKDASEVNFLSIMQVPMGPVDKWTYEEKAWYSKLMLDVGIDREGITQFLEPSGRISEQEAIMIAKREVAAGYKVDESKLDSYQIAVSFEIPEAAELGNRQAYWHVKFTAPSEMAKEERLFILFPVYVHPEDGSLLWPVQEMLNMTNYHTRPSNDIYNAFGSLEAEAHGANFRDWPLKLKAQFSQKVAPLVKEVLDSKDLSSITLFGTLDVELIAQSSYVYGMPSGTSISQEKALELAMIALSKKYGIQDNLASLYRRIPVYYDVTNAVMPKWRFVFNWGVIDQDKLSKLESSTKATLSSFCFRVEVDALKGESVSVERFEFKHQMDNLDYRLNWY